MAFESTLDVLVSFHFLRGTSWLARSGKKEFANEISVSILTFRPLSRPPPTNYATKYVTFSFA